MTRGVVHFIAIGAGLGLVVPLVFRLLYGLQSAETIIPSEVWPVLDYMQLMLWPIPLLMAPVDEPGAADLSAWGPFVVAVLANVSLYAGLASMLWAGFARWKPLLVVPLAIVAAIWYAVWTT